MFNLFRVVILPGLLTSFFLIASGSAQKDERTDQWLEQPVADATFQAYLDFFSYNEHLPFELQIINVEDVDGIKKQHLSFQSTPGVQVFANYYSALVAPRKDARSVILLHGGVPRGKESRVIKSLANLLVRDRWSVLAIDMQYFGERSTDLLTTFTEEDKHERLYNQPSVYLAWVTQTVKDVRRSFDLLVQQMEGDPERIALIGFSRGAQVGTIVGGAERRLVAVALLHCGHFDRSEHRHLAAACPANYIGRIAPRPLLMINGTHDNDYFKDTQVQPLQRLAKSPKLIRWADTGHGIINEEDRSVMLQWLRENVK